MIGRRTKASDPAAVFLRDGDVVIMSRYARMSYHAVPRVLPRDHFINTSQVSDTTTDKQTATHNQLEWHTNEPSGDKSQSLTQNGSHKRYSQDTASAASAKRCKQEELRDVFDEELVKELRDKESSYWSRFEAYIDNNRINLNVRQMFHPDKGPDDYVWPLVDTWKPSES